MSRVQPEPGARGGLFRSEDMAYVHLYVPQDGAREIVRELGEARAVQLTDLNKAHTTFQRPYATDVRRCEELQRKLRWFKTLLDDHKIPEHAGGRESSMEEKLSLDGLEETTGEIESSLVQADQHHRNLTKELNDKREHRMVLEACGHLFSEVDRLMTNQTDVAGSEFTNPLLENDMESMRSPDALLRVRIICGVVADATAPVFERVLFRATRGICLVRFGEEPIDLVDARGHTVPKRVFAVFYSGERLEAKIAKVADALHANRFPFSHDSSERQRHLAQLAKDIADLNMVVDQTNASLRNQLVAVRRDFTRWSQFVNTEKQVLHALNMFETDAARSGVVGEGWCPVSRLRVVQQALQRGATMARLDAQPICTVIESTMEPPTHFHTNNITAGFQAIVDAYGVACYKEFNPAPFTVITFPFLFAVMFGDVGHGMLLLGFTLWMLKNEQYYLKNKPGEIFGICFGGRYVLLLMSLFSVYTGLLYNETFSMPLNLFDSPYHVEYDGKVNGTVLYHVTKSDHTYAFGVDPIWKQSDNELSFTNPLKMKMSIVLGVVQMTFGILLSALNYLYFRDWVSLVNVFVPQILFLSSIFGYMVVLILTKWATLYHNTNCAPSILTTFINMFLSMGKVEKVCDDGSIIPNQEMVQKILLVVAVVAVPWLLLAKPLVERAAHRSRARELSHPAARNEAQLESPVLNDSPPAGAHHEDFDFGEELVHNIIHTIEFVLGAVSNTASYLRLWALSLAHGQLSTVFWEKTMVDQLPSGNPAIIVAAFFVWVMCTLAVLMVMESLSAFLHALRLHWVEFQNKFYHGTGVKFVPFALNPDGVQEE